MSTPDEYTKENLYLDNCPEGMVPTKGWRPKKALLAPLLPRWFKRLKWVHKFLCWLDIRGKRYVLEPFFPFHVSEITLEDCVKSGERLKSMQKEFKCSCGTTMVYWGETMTKCPGCGKSGPKPWGWKPNVYCKPGDRVLHNAQARDGKYWSYTPSLYGTVREINNFTKLVTVDWDDGVEREPLPPSVLATSVLSLQREPYSSGNLNEPPPKPGVSQITLDEDVLAQYKRWEETRIFSEKNPPKKSDLVQIAPNLYKATDDTLWEIGPECYFRPHR
jgi:hypothetical protein